MKMVYIVYDVEDNTFSYHGYESVLSSVFAKEEDAKKELERLRYVVSKQWDSKTKSNFIYISEQELK